MPPATPWARLLAVITRSPPSSMLPLNPVTTSTSVPRTSSPPLLATRTPPWTYRSALRTPSRLAQTAAPSRLVAKLDYCGPRHPSLLRKTISCTPVVWSAYGRPHQDTLTVLQTLSKFVARKRNFDAAEVVLQRLHSSITLEIWTRSARQIHSCWPLEALPVPWTRASCLCLGHLGWASPGLLLLQPLVLWYVRVFGCSRLLVFWSFRRAYLAQSSSDSWRFSSPVWCPWMTWSRTASSPFWRRHPGSSPSHPVTANERALPASLSRPRSCSRSPLPKAAPNRHGSIQLSQRGPTSLAVKSCPLARPNAPAPPVTALALRTLLLVSRSLGAPPARLALPPCPRLAPRVCRPAGSSWIFAAQSR